MENKYPLPTFRLGSWSLEWSYDGEGCWGDYDPQDQDDMMLLRATLECSVSDEPLQNNSYCTLAPYGTPESTLESMSADLFNSLSSDSNQCNWRKVMERWTWRTCPTSNLELIEKE